MATNKRVLGRLGFYLGLAVFLIITLFPFFVMLMTSLKSAKEAISLHPTILPQAWTLQHYIDIFNPLIFPFVDYFRNSMVVSLTSSIIAVFSARWGLTRYPNCVLKDARRSMRVFTPSICSRGFCWWCRCSKSSPRWGSMTRNWR